jgi:hypothetical protein
MNTFLKLAGAVLLMVLPALSPVNAQVARYKMTTDIPTSITTPDIVETSLGTLRFFDGFPDPESAKKCMIILTFKAGYRRFLIIYRRHLHMHYEPESEHSAPTTRLYLLQSRSWIHAACSSPVTLKPSTVLPGLIHTRGL